LRSVMSAIELSDPRRWIEANFDGRFSAVLAQSMEFTPGTHGSGLRITKEGFATAGLMRSKSLRNQQLESLA